MNGSARARLGFLRNRTFQATASLIVGAVFLWLALSRIDIAQLWRNLVQVDLNWLLLALATYWVALTLRSWRWRIILAPVRRMAFRAVYQGLLVGYAANYVLPARLGELVRADFLGRRYRLPFLTVIGTIVVERLFDIVVFVVFILAGLKALHLRHDGRIEPVLHAVEIVTVACAVLALGLVVLLRLRDRPLPRRIAFFQRQLQSLADGLHLITGLREVAALTAATAVVWMADSLATWLLCRSLGIDLQFFPLLLVMGMSCLAALIPAAPANIGALQYALVLAFQLLGLPGDSGFSLALLTQGCFVASCILVGGGLYVRATLKPVDSVAPN
jgi:glycosyltransferase 2 family protein